MHLRLFNKHGGHIHFNYEQNICTSSKNPNEERQGCFNDRQGTIHNSRWQIDEDLDISESKC